MKKGGVKKIMRGGVYFIDAFFHSKKKWKACRLCTAGKHSRDRDTHWQGDANEWKGVCIVIFRENVGIVDSKRKLRPREEEAKKQKGEKKREPQRGERILNRENNVRKRKVLNKSKYWVSHTL